MRSGSCGVGDGNWACVVRRRVGKGIQGACAPMAERWAGALLRRGLRELLDRANGANGPNGANGNFLWALRKQRGDAYGCHLPARGGPPTCAGLLLAWWRVGDAVGGRGRFAARCALL